MASGQQLTIQDALQQLIEAEPLFSSFTIYQRKEGGVQSVIYAKEAIEIGLPRLGSKMPNQPLPFFETIKIPVKLFFNRRVAALTYEPSDAAEMLASLIDLSPYGSGDSDTFTLDDPPIEHTEDSTHRSVKTVNVVVAGGLTIDRPQVATPILSGTSAVTATCATAGAAMFYTLNGDFPNPRLGTLYTGPVAVSSGQTISVIGWLAGYTRSLQASYTRP